MSPPATLVPPTTSILPRDSVFSYAGSDDAKRWEENVRKIWREFREPISHRDVPLRERFAALAARWRDETAHLSSSTAIFTHPAYQQIIGMGPVVLPYLLADLAETRSHWFWALRAIARENPVPKHDQGNIERMITAWLAWGVRRGLL